MIGTLRRSPLWVALVMLGLVAVACGGGEASTSATPGAPVAAAPAADTGADDAIIPPTASGGQLNFNDLLGTPTMLWFWAPW